MFKAIDKKFGSDFRFVRDCQSTNINTNTHTLTKKTKTTIHVIVSVSVFTVNFPSNHCKLFFPFQSPQLQQFHRQQNKNHQIHFAHFYSNFSVGPIF